MSYEVRLDKGYAVVLLTGDVDLHKSPDARAVILKCLDDRKHTLVDLSGVEYIDSSGVASLVEALQKARDHGVDFALVGVSAPAMNVFKLARLDQVFTIYPSIDDCPVVE
jgi:anti-sigma B factor antagonist